MMPLIIDSGFFLIFFLMGYKLGKKSNQDEIASLTEENTVLKEHVSRSKRAKAKKNATVLETVTK